MPCETLCNHEAVGLKQLLAQQPVDKDKGVPRSFRASRLERCHRSRLIPNIRGRLGKAEGMLAGRCLERRRLSRAMIRKVREGACRDSSMGVIGQDACEPRRHGAVSLDAGEDQV
jgi:hypothetical protein